MKEIPTATHMSKIKLGSFEIEVARLDNGQAAVTEEGMINFLKFLQSGEEIIQEEIDQFARLIKK